MFAVVILLFAGLCAVSGQSDETFYDRDPLSAQYGLPGLPPNSRRVPSGVVCGNSAAFVLTAALEIAYQTLTGEIPTKLAEQEIIDCYYSGCFFANLDDIVKWLEVKGTLSSEAGYMHFLGGWDVDNSICRASHAQNALQVTMSVFKAITVDEFDAELAKNGFVFAMIGLDENSCEGYYKRKSQVFSEGFYDMYRDKDFDGLIDGYTSWWTGENGHVVSGDYKDFVDTYVLIVGTHVDEDGIEYFIVRDTRGDVWMRRGHFLIPRGFNHCGIESALHTVTIELNDNHVGCPPDAPKFCPHIKTCTRADQECVDDEAVDVTGYDPETSAPANKDKEWDFAGDECKDAPGFELTCADLAKTWRNCQSNKIRQMCAGSCLVCAEACEDHKPTTAHSSCNSLSRYCSIAGVISMCPSTCHLHPSDCGSLEDNINLMAGIGKPHKGKCYAPDVPNGRVLNGPILQNGEALEIECDDGYTLSGEQNYCVIQDMFGPDSRILQSCIMVTDEDWDSWEGNGENYRGTRSETLQFSRCANWQSAVLPGLFGPTADVDLLKAAAAEGSKMNHNYCRNPGGVAPVPFCLTSEVNLDVYRSLDKKMSITVAGEDDEDVDSLAEDGVLTVPRAEIMYCEPLPRCGGGYCEFAQDHPIWGWMCNGKSSCAMDTATGMKTHYSCRQYCCREIAKCEETPTPAPATGSTSMGMIVTTAAPTEGWDDWGDGGDDWSDGGDDWSDGGYDWSDGGDDWSDGGDDWSDGGDDWSDGGDDWSDGGDDWSDGGDDWSDGGDDGYDWDDSGNNLDDGGDEWSDGDDWSVGGDDWSDGGDDGSYDWDSGNDWDSGDDWSDDGNDWDSGDDWSDDGNDWDSGDDWGSENDWDDGGWASDTEDDWGSSDWGNDDWGGDWKR